MKSCRCGFKNFTESKVTPRTFCNLFGHDEGRICIDGTAQIEATRMTDPYGDSMGVEYYNIYSYEYKYKCSRCGNERIVRKTKD